MGLLTGDVFWSNAAERCSALKSVAKKYLIEDYSGFNEYCGEDDFLVLASGVDSEYDNPEAEEREYIRFISNMKYVDAESDPRFDVTAPVIYRILTPEQRLKVNEIIEEFKSEHGEYHDYTALMKNDEGFDYDGFTDDELIVFNESVDSFYLSIYDKEVTDIITNVSGPMKNTLILELLENRLDRKMKLMKGENFDELTEEEQYAVRLKSAKKSYLLYRDEGKREIRGKIFDEIGDIVADAMLFGVTDVLLRNEQYGLGFHDFRYYRSLFKKSKLYSVPNKCRQFEHKYYGTGRGDKLSMPIEDKLNLHSKRLQAFKALGKFIAVNEKICRRIEYLTHKAAYYYYKPSNIINLEIYAAAIARLYMLKRLVFPVRACIGKYPFGRPEINALYSLLYDRELKKAYWLNLFNGETGDNSSDDSLYDKSFIGKVADGYYNPEAFMLRYGEHETSKDKMQETVIRRIQAKKASLESHGTIDHFHDIRLNCAWIMINKPAWMTDKDWKEYNSLYEFVAEEKPVEEDADMLDDDEEDFNDFKYTLPDDDDEEDFLDDSMFDEDKVSNEQAKRHLRFCGLEYSDEYLILKLRMRYASFCYAADELYAVMDNLTERYGFQDYKIK